jgi:hypothetical protein
VFLAMAAASLNSENTQLGDDHLAIEKIQQGLLLFFIFVFFS